MGAYSAAGLSTKNFAVFQRGRSRSYAKYFGCLLFYMFSKYRFALKLFNSYSEPERQASLLFTFRWSQFMFLMSVS